MKKILAPILLLAFMAIAFAQAVKTGYFDVLVPNNPASTFIDIRTDLSINGSTVKIADIVDDDTLAADSATSLVTEQAIKAYVDSSIAGSGDVVGPVSSTDNAVTRYDGVTGKLVQDSAVTIDDTGVVTADNLFLNGSSIDVGSILKRRASTGLKFGGTCSINGGDNTKFDVVAGEGTIGDFSVITAPTITEVPFAGATAITVTNLATDDNTWVYVNAAGAITQTTTAPTPNTLRNSVFLCRLGHTNRLNLGAALNHPVILSQDANNLHDFADIFGTINKSGNVISANGATLQLNKSAGVLYSQNSNFSVDPQNPSEIALGALSPVTFRYATQTTIGASDVTSVSGASYDLGGTITAISGSNNRATIQRIFITGINNVRIQYGQAVYSTLAAAKAAINTEAFIPQPTLVEAGLLRAILVITKGCADLTDTSCSSIIEVGKFGQGSVGAAGGGTTTLQNAYTNSTDGIIVVDSTVGAVKVQDASTPTGANLFEVTDNAAANEFFKVDATYGPQKIVDGADVPLGANPDKLNLLVSPSFETSITEGSCIFCTAAAETSVKLPTGENTRSLSVTQSFGFGAYSVNKITGSEYLATQVAASCWIKTSATGIQFKALVDAAPVVTKEVSSDGNWNEYIIPFVAGTTSIGYQVTGGATSDVIYVDECFLGAKNVLNKVGYDTGWENYTPTFIGLGTVSAQSFKYRRSGDSIEVKGNFIAGIPTAVKASVSLPAGLSIDTSKVDVISDDVSIGQSIGLSQGTGGTNFRSVVLTAILSSSTAVYFGGSDASATQLIPTNGNSLSATGTNFSVFFKVPIRGWKATFDSISDVGDPLYISGKIYDSAGGNIFATNTATPVIWTDADLVMELSNGSAEIPCSGSNPPTGLTCSTGSEQVGIVFTNKTLGKHRVCMNAYTSSGSTVAINNRIVYTTAADSDTARSTSNNLITTGGANAINSTNLCEIFNLTSIGEHKFVLAQEAATADGSLYLDRSTANYERDFSFSVEQIDNQINAIIKVEATQLAPGSNVINWSLSDVYTYSIAAGQTYTFSDVPAVKTIIVIVTNTTGGDLTVNFPAGIKWPFGTVVTNIPANSANIYTFVVANSTTYVTAVEEMK